MATQRQEQEATEAARQSSMDPAVMTAAGSVIASWYFFFVQGNKERGLFVGLWPPTILAFASYFKQTRMSDKLRRAVEREGMIERVGREGVVEQIRKRV